MIYSNGFLVKRSGLKSFVKAAHASPLIGWHSKSPPDGNDGVGSTKFGIHGR